MTFAAATVAEAKRQDEVCPNYRKRFVEAAQRIHHRDGEIEIDDSSVVSDSDDEGEYVLAWVWISNEDAGLESDYDNATDTDASKTP